MREVSIPMRRAVEALGLAFKRCRSQRELERALGASPCTVNEYRTRFVASGLIWPLPTEMDEATLRGGAPDGAHSGRLGARSLGGAADSGAGLIYRHVPRGTDLRRRSCRKPSAVRHGVVVADAGQADRAAQVAVLKAFGAVPYAILPDLIAAGATFNIPAPGS